MNTYIPNASIVQLPHNQVNVICDTNYSGLKCFNNDQPDGKCLDYEVRFLCEPKDANCKPTTQLSRSTTSKCISLV